MTCEPLHAVRTSTHGSRVSWSLGRQSCYFGMQRRSASSPSRMQRRPLRSLKPTRQVVDIDIPLVLSTLTCMRPPTSSDPTCRQIAQQCCGMDAWRWCLPHSWCQGTLWRFRWVAMCPQTSGWLSAYRQHCGERAGTLCINLAPASHTSMHCCRPVSPDIPDLSQPQGASMGRCCALQFKVSPLHAIAGVTNRS